jgi:formylglycine-generating enzyme required for sulfatase activity
MPIIDGQLAILDEARGIYRAAHPLVVNEKEGSVLVEVPAGEFEMGDGKKGDCPKHRVYLDRYWIGIYCVSNRQYERFVRETGHRAPGKADYGNPAWQNGRCPEGKLDHPVVCVSWEDAVAYAKWAGCSLPSEAQWEKAARGPRGLIYPWGDEWDEKECRNDRNKGSEQTSVVWGYPMGCSGHGTYNQSGNVWEWCADWWDEGYHAKGPTKNPKGPETGSYRVYRGGSWWNDDPSYFRGAYRGRNVPSDRDDGLGFRLVRTL